MRESCADPDRQAVESLREILVVLARQQRRRHDDGDLLAVDRRAESGAQRDLGLAEADIAAHEPIHRPPGGEIVEHGVDRARLILGLVIGKARAEFVVEPLGRRQAWAPACNMRCAAIAIRPFAISRMRFFMRALRPCQPAPPKRSSATSVSSEP